MHRQNLSRNKQALYFVLGLVALLGAFFTLLYFHFLPANRNRIHKDIFNILRTNAAYIKLETERVSELYSRYIESKVDSVPTVKLVREINIEIRKNKLYDTVSWKDKADTNRIDDAGFRFERKVDRRILQYKYSYATLLQQIETDQENELIRKYMLATSSQVLFSTSDLSVGTDFEIDSFISGENRFVSGTFLLSVDDELNRVFYFPFTLRHQELYLCGFIPEKVYRSELFRLNDGFVYGMVAVLVLLIITQPILRLLLMGRHEAVKFNGFVLFIASLFGGSTAITLLTLHILMLSGSSVRSKDNLARLSMQMEESFRQEREEALDMLNRYDRLVYNGVEKNKREAAAKRIKSLMVIDQKNGGYDRIDRIFWIDNKTGMQELKVERGPYSVGKIDVHDRNYFKQALPVNTAPGQTTGENRSFAMEALRNRVNGAFRIILAMPSRWEDHVCAISADMRTWREPLLPVGYGFCLIDENGKVQAHDKGNKNLREDLFDRLPEPGLIRQAIKGREPRFKTDVQLYGQNTDLYFQPLQGMPYYLVVYYKKNYDTAVALKIVVFTLAHIALIYLIYFVAWFLYFGRKMGEHHRLFAPINLVGWLIPSHRNWPFYLKGALILLTGVAGTILAMISSPQMRLGNTLVFFLVMSSPIQVVSALALAHARERKRRNVFRWFRPSVLSSKTLLVFNICLQALIIIAAIAVFREICAELIWVVCMQLIPWLWIWPSFNGMPFISQFFPRLSNRQRREAGMYRYRTVYFAYMSLLILSVAIIPATAITWMAHNIELTQQVKKQELYLASRLFAREKDGQNELSRILDADSSHRQQVMETSGIFSPLTFSLARFSGICPPSSPEMAEEYYYEVSGNVASRVYDPLFYPTLPNDPGNGQWCFRNKRKSIGLWYRVLGVNPVNAGDITGLQVQMVPGPRFVYFRWSWKGISLGIFILLVLTVLVKTLKYGIASFFLWKYLDAARSRRSVLASARTRSWKETVPFDPFLSASMPSHSKDHIEADVMNAVDNNRIHFEHIWENCSDKEKFMLVDFAHDGLLNYKNNYEITKLIDKRILIPHRRLDIFRLFSASFRLFVLTKKNSHKMSLIEQKYNRASMLGSFRFILMLVAVAFFTFIFFTQNEIFDKILALTGSIVTVLANLTKITGATSQKQGQ